MLDTGRIVVGLYNAPMPRDSLRPINLAIETSGRVGSITLGRGDVVLASTRLPQVRRHNLELTPTIDRLFGEHDLKPAQLGELYISLGPGSFTGLRIGIATAKMLALAGKVNIVGVPTLDVLAQNLIDPPEVVQDESARLNTDRECKLQSKSTHAVEAMPANLAVCLNLKRATMHCGLFTREGDQMTPTGEQRLRTIEQLLAQSPRPLALLGDPLPSLPADVGDAVTVLPAALAVARSEAVWRLGRRLAEQGRFVDPDALVPLYIREPEAVTLWRDRAAGRRDAGSR